MVGRRPAGHAPHTGTRTFTTRCALIMSSIARGASSHLAPEDPVETTPSSDSGTPRVRETLLADSAGCQVRALKLYDVMSPVERPLLAAHRTAKSARVRRSQLRQSA